MKNVAILASYNGSGLSALHQAQLEKKLNINIQVVISNNTNAVALKKAKEYKIANFLVNSKTDVNPDTKISSILQEYQCEYIFLSGYMKKLSAELTNDFKVINSHPALLPSYAGAGMYGIHVHEAVIKNKELYSGVTVHEVNENYDEGAIILQKQLKLHENETVESLEKRVKELEQTAIVEALQLCLK